MGGADRRAFTSDSSRRQVAKGKRVMFASLVEGDGDLGGSS